MLKYYILACLLIGYCKSEIQSAEKSGNATEVSEPILPAAYHTDQYLPLLDGQKVGVVVNHTSTIDETHIVDSLLSIGVDLAAIFAPEHGFSGHADAGEHIEDGKYLSRIPVYSLHGKTKKPTEEMLVGLDVIVFDIQDVGARFYTYISTLHYVMEAAAENEIPVVILDRPNPNGHYIDGPIMEEEYQSFVGMHPVPVVYGMTIGEYGQMINGEKWLANGAQCELTVIPCSGYTHDSYYDLPISPSPNLPNARSVLLYPSLCLYEGTTASVGRGTETQFQIYGHPDMRGDYSFTPISRSGAKYPKHESIECHGVDLTMLDPAAVKSWDALRWDYLIDGYQRMGSDPTIFFIDNNFFEKLAGTAEFREQISDGWTMEEIRATWQPGLSQFRAIREQYLIYD